MTHMWMTDTYRARRWSYVAVPKVGDFVRYMRDGFDSTVVAVRWDRIVMSDSTVFKRRVDWDSIYARIARKFGRKFGRKRRSSFRPLRPREHYVGQVVIQL